jgi:hypothetical protein
LLGGEGLAGSDAGLKTLTAKDGGYPSACFGMFTCRYMPLQGQGIWVLGLNTTVKYTLTMVLKLISAK